MTERYQGSPSQILPGEPGSRKISTGTREANKALQGGIPMAALTAITGPAGCGKTTLCLQMALDWTRVIPIENTALFVSGEHFPEQLVEKVIPIARDPHFDRETVSRMFMNARDPRDPLELAIEIGASVLFIDRWDGIKKSKLANFAHKSGLAVITADRVISDDDIGLADVVLHMDLIASNKNARLLKLRKNRFGNTDAVGRLLITTQGLLSDDAGTLAKHHFRT